MERSIDELLSDEPAIANQAPQEEHAPQEQPDPQAEAPERQRDESGRFASKQTGEVEQGEPAQEPTPGNPIPDDQFKGYLTEKRKRQELEQELENLRSTVQQLQAPKEPPAPPPSVWEDENAWGGSLVNQAVQQATFNARLDMSEMMVRQANPDFDDMKAKFLELAGTNPTLREQALADPHPWAKAYQIAKNAAQVEELGAVNLDDLKAKMREELMAEMQGQAPAPRLSAPPSLTGERNVGARTGPAWAGPKSLDDLLR